MKKPMIATAILLILLLGIAIKYAYIKHMEVVKLLRDRELVEKLVYAEAKIITRYKDGHARRPMPVIDNQVSQKEAKKIVNISDTVGLAIAILKKRIADLTIINTTLTEQNLIAQERIDSLNHRVYLYEDKFLKLAYRPDTAGAGELDFKYNADLTVTPEYGKRNGFFSPKKNYIDIYSNDPRTTVNGVKRLVLERGMPTKFRIQSSLIYNMNGVFTGGITGRFEIKKVSLSGSYFYSPLRDKWVPVVGFNYDLIRF